MVYSLHQSNQSFTIDFFAEKVKGVCVCVRACVCSVRVCSVRVCSVCVV